MNLIVQQAAFMCWHSLSQANCFTQAKKYSAGIIETILSFQDNLITAWKMEMVMRNMERRAEIT